VTDAGETSPRPALCKTLPSTYTFRLRASPLRGAALPPPRTRAAFGLRAGAQAAVGSASSDAGGSEYPSRYANDSEIG
jgi:hypothetical protein